jgi:hypothetical protein
MIEIPLSRGMYALIDDEDEWLTDWKWHALVSRHTFYAARNTPRDSEGKQRKILMHLELITPPVGMFVDHENRNGLDNQKYNLRPVTRSQNALNTGKLHGVAWDTLTGKWRAYITIDNKWTHIGRYDDFDEAILARKNAERQCFGIADA